MGYNTFDSTKMLEGTSKPAQMEKYLDMCASWQYDGQPKVALNQCIKNQYNGHSKLAKIQEHQILEEKVAETN